MRTSNELRVFISSTFRDLQEEREHLVKKIFPEIRALCRVRGVTFTDIDLRWGITDEEAEREGIVNICLDEIDRCRPWFIGILGERYGWVPASTDAERASEQFPSLSTAHLSGTSITEMEIVHGVLANPTMAGHAFFYFRDRNATAHEFIDDDANAVQRLTTLKQRIRQSGFPVREGFSSPVELGEWLETDLRQVIEAEYPESDTPTPLELERRSHSAFAASRTRAYIPNPAHLKEFTRWATHGSSPLIVHAPSGLGKSSLVAWLVESFKRENPSAFVIEHYVGASRSSGSSIAVMRHIIDEVRDRFGLSHEAPVRDEEIERTFPNWIFRCDHLAREAGIPVLIVVDAVNQLDDAGRRMAWLPTVFPAGMKIIVSTTPGETEERLTERGWQRMKLEPIDDERVRQSIVARYLGEFRKGISASQLSRVVTDPKASSPLYLRVVAEELRLHGQHETIPQLIDRYVAAADLHDVFDIMLERTEHDFAAIAVRNMLTAIWASRSGLSETELMEVARISRLELSRLLFAFDYHLVQREELLDFFHDYLRQGVERRYLSRPSDIHMAHTSLIRHFESLPAGTRSSRELVWNLHAIGDTDRLKTVLSDIEHFMTLYWKSTEFEVLSYWSEVGSGNDIEEAYREGLERWRSSESKGYQEIYVLGRIGEFLERKGRLHEALRLQHERLALAGQLDNKVEAARARIQLGALRMFLGEMTLALDELRIASDEFAEQNMPEEMATAIGHMGTVYYALGDLDQALDCFARCHDISQELGDRRQIAYSYGNMGNIYRVRREFDRALECFSVWESISRERGDLRGVAFAVGNIGSVWMDREEYDKALIYLRETETIGRELGDAFILSVVLVNIGMSHSRLREYDRALECFQEVEIASRERGDRSGLMESLSSTGRILISRQEYERALQCLDEAEALAREIGDQREVLKIVLRQERAYRERGDQDRAFERCERGEELAISLDNPRERWNVVHARGRLQLMRREYDRALHSFRAATAGHREIGYEHGVAQSLAGAARVILHLIEYGKETPSYLVTHFPELSDHPEESWNEVLLRRGRESIDESIAIAESIRDVDWHVSYRILLARYDATEGNRERAIDTLRDMIDRAFDDFEAGELRYWLWRYTGSDDEREEALRLYRSIPETKLSSEDRERFLELLNET